MTVAIANPNLNHHGSLPVLHDKIEFATAATVILLNQCQATGQQVFQCAFFAALSTLVSDCCLIEPVLGGFWVFNAVFLRFGFPGNDRFFAALFALPPRNGRQCGGFGFGSDGHVRHG